MEEYIAPDSTGKWLQDPLSLNLLEALGRNLSNLRDKYATGFERSDSTASGSGIARVALDGAELPALQAARDLSRRNEDNAAEELEASNIAVLALPMIFTLLPAALFADVSTRTSASGLLSFKVSAVLFPHARCSTKG